MPPSLKTFTLLSITLFLFLGITTTVFAANPPPGPAVESDAPGTPGATGGELSSGGGVIGQAGPPAHFFEGLLDECREKGNCTVCDVFKLFANIVKWILGTIGALALFWVIYGGFDILTSAGNTTKVDSGKKKIMGAIIGMLIVLAAWTLVNAIILFLVVPTQGTLESDKDFSAKNLFITPGEWAKIKCE